MDTLLQLAVSNALAATALAIVAVGIGKIWHNPAVLHMLWLLVLLKLVMPPIVSIPVPWVALDDVGTQRNELNPMNPASDDVETAPLAVRTLPATENVLEALPETLAGAPLAVPTSEFLPQSLIPNASVSPLPQNQHIDYKLCVLGVWMASSFVWIGLLVYRVVGFHRLLRNAKPASEAVIRRTKQICRLLGLRNCPSVLMLIGRISPVVWPLSTRVTVVLPEELFQRIDHESQETLLAHELAHIRRRDHWVRLLEILTTSLFWWHPVLWWARRQLHQMEEQCCDSEVLRVLPDSARSYANALVDTVAFMRGTHGPLPIATTGAHPSCSLKRRIEMIMKDKSEFKFSPLHFTAVGIVAFATLPFAIVRAQGVGPAVLDRESGELRVNTKVDEKVRFYPLVGPAVLDRESGELRPFYKIKKSDGAIGFNYYKFTLIRIGTDLFALHVLPDPRFGNGQGITYRWYSTNDGSDFFMSNLTRKDDDGATPHHEVTVGSGDTYEIDYGIGAVSIGRTKLQWSARNDHSGWLYVRNTDKGISVYSEQFDGFADFSRRLDDSRWIQLSIAKSQAAEPSDARADWQGLIDERGEIPPG